MEQAWFLGWIRKWLDLRYARIVLLGIAFCLSLPAVYEAAPKIGPDPSWELAVQMAAIQQDVFGRDFVFTYGPLGYLQIHAPVNKIAMLVYDFFVLGSLMAIYRRFLPQKIAVRDAFLIIGVAMITKSALLLAPSAILFTILLFWFWRIFEKGDALAVAGTLISAFLLFFGKVNYGIISLIIIPTYGVSLLLTDRKRQGLIVLLGFALSIFLGIKILHVDLPGYIRSGGALSSNNFPIGNGLHRLFRLEG